MQSQERTFVLLKPDAVKRSLAGKIIARFEGHLKLESITSLQAEDELIKKHYKEHEGKPYFEDLVKFMTSGKVIAMIWSGPNAVKIARVLLGEVQNPKIGTIRHEFREPDAPLRENLCHASDSIESAKREIELWDFFGPFQ
jgi:nucleoside-diphosphate kinase